MMAKKYTHEDTFNSSRALSISILFAQAQVVFRMEMSTKKKRVVCTSKRGGTFFSQWIIPST